MDIYNEYGIILTIGIYAANDKESYKEIKEYLAKVVDDYKDVKQVHGFYVDEENKSIYFDLIIDFADESQEKTKHEIINKMEQKYPDYKFDAILDADFSE